jgi:hypothetical protein
MGVIKVEQLIKPQTGLRDETLALLRNRSVAGLSMASIARGTGLTIGWLQSFQAEVAYSPGVVQVETLNCYLKQNGVTI